jgi:hypothetical protein
MREKDGYWSWQLEDMAKFKKKRTKAQIEDDPRIVELWAEADDAGCFGDGSGISWWATLAPGYEVDDCHGLHEGTVKDIAAQLNGGVTLGRCDECRDIHGNEKVE